MTAAVPTGLRLGALSVVGVPDGIGSVRPELLYSTSQHTPVPPGGHPADWLTQPGFCPAESTLEMPVGCFLIRSRDRTVLVDAGYGADRPANISGSDLLTGLRGLGVAPEDVTDVVLTHLHPDHIGWVSSNGRATFPHALHRCSGDDWTHFVEGAQDEHAPDLPYRRAAARTLRSLESRFEIWSTESTVAPGIDVVAAPGHTPGSAIVVLSSGSERAVLLGDLVHHPVQLVDDAWSRAVDVDGDRARSTQRRLTEEFVRGRTPVVGSHFPGLRFGRVVEVDGVRQWQT